MNTLNVDPKAAALVAAAAKKAGTAQALEAGKLEGKSTGLTLGLAAAGLIGVAVVGFVVLQNKQAANKKEAEHQQKYVEALESRVMLTPEQKRSVFI